MTDTTQAVGTARDFDFWMGSWNVRNRLLRARLRGSDDWEEFAATAVARPILDGLGNEDEFRTGYRGGFVAMSFRFFDPVSRRWSIPRWEQAFSDDGGATWEANWMMDFTRREGTR